MAVPKNVLNASAVDKQPSGHSPERSSARRLDPAGAAHLVLGLAASAPLAAIFVLGLSNRFQADDFSIVARFRLYGVLGAVSNQVHEVNGRFAGFVFSDPDIAAG